MLTVDTTIPLTSSLRSHEPSPLVLGSPVPPPTAGSTGTDDSFSTAPLSSPLAHPAASWSNPSERSDGEEVLMERADEADDEVSPLSTESMRDKMERSVKERQGGDHVIIASGNDSVDRLAIYRERSLFVENFDHEVTPEEISAFLYPSKPILAQHHVQLNPGRRPHIAVSPPVSSASSSTTNLLSRVMSRESSSGAPKPPMLRFLGPPQPQRPGAVRSRTSPDDLPTQDSLRNRVQSKADGDTMSRRSSLGIAPGEIPANVLRKPRPATMFAPSLGVMPATPRKEKSGSAADGSPSPQKKRPLSGLFRKVSISKKDKPSTRSPPIRSSVIVTAPTPPRSSAVQATVERQSSRRGRPTSSLGPPLPEEHLHVFGTKPPSIPPRSSSSMDEARPAMTAHNDLGRYTSVDSLTGSTSSKSQASTGGGWRNLWRRRKGGDAVDGRRDSLPGLTLSSGSSRTGGRPRASTFDSNSDSSGSRWTAYTLQTPTTPTTQLVPQLADVSIITGPSHSLPRIEEDGQVDTSKVAPGAVSIATEVKTSMDSDIVVIPPAMMEDAIEVVPDAAAAPAEAVDSSPDTSMDSGTLGRPSLDDVVASEVSPTQSLSEMTLREGQAPGHPPLPSEDKIEVMIVPSSVTGRPKPKVWGSWPSMGNPRPITLKTTGGSPTRRKSNAGQWLASGAGEDNAGAELAEEPAGMAVGLGVKA